MTMTVGDVLGAASTVATELGNIMGGWRIMGVKCRRRRLIVLWLLLRI